MINGGTFLSTESFAQYQDPTQRQQCRICLQLLDARLPPICECRGNHRNVHEGCLREWARRAQKFRDGKGNVYFYCDLCKTPIVLAHARRCRLKTKAEFYREVTQNYCKLGLILLIFLFFAGILVVTIAAMLSNPQPKGVYFTLIGISGVMVCFSLPLLVVRVAVECKEEVVGFVSGLERRGSNVVANSYSLQEN